ncbi:MAG: ATP-binding protein [Chitinophagales bacterium]
MTSSKLFLEKLLLKLKTGSSRSIHLNALPGRFARLDLFDLINVDQSLHLKFINQLLSKEKFNFNISIDFKLIQKKSNLPTGKGREEIKAAHQIAKTLNAIFYQQQDEFLEHGTKTFAFGYPLLIKRDPTNTDRILKAPLLIWYLDLEKDSHKSNSWSISRNENHPVIFNEVLRSHIETYEQIQMDDILELLEENLISESQILNICKLMLEKLGTTASSFDEELLVLPGTNKASIEKITKNDPWIRWSGIFGMYKTQKQSIIHDIESLIEHFDEKDEPKSIPKEVEGNTTLSVVPLDPSQEHILNTVTKESQIVIQGPPGTGKSQSLTALISNALYHGKTCLVVCEKKTALDVIYKNLAAHNLSELCIIIEDVYSDRKTVVDKVRHLLETRSETEIDFRHFDFEENLTAYLNDQNTINKHIDALNFKCFGDDKLIALIAKRQKLIQTNNLQPLSVKPIQFLQLNYKEFKTLKKVVDEGQQIFQPLEGKSIPFEKIKDDFFIDNSNLALLKLEILQMLTNAETILKTLANHQTSGAAFDELKGWPALRLKISAPFLKHAKQLQQDQAFVLEQYLNLINTYHQHRYFDFHFVDPQNIDKLSELQAPLTEFINIIEPIHNHIDQLKNYLPWRKFLIEHATYQPLLKALSKQVSFSQWLVSFEMFYNSKFIEQYIKDNSIDFKLKNTLNHIAESDESVRTQLGDKILSLWDEKQKGVLKKRTISNIKNLYNYRRNKAYGRRNSLRKIIHNDVELFTNAFPVVMVNPSVCSSIFPLEKDLFDLVIFDEASQLRIEDTYTALLRGHHKVVSGDKHQMPPTSYFQSNVQLSAIEEEEEMENEVVSDDFLAESDSLLEYCMDSDFESTFLDFHYRSQHPDLISFSNKAFYGDRLVPMPQQKHYNPISYFQVNGVYDNRTNQTEAKALVDFVFEKIQPINDEFPSVGIATFNMNQRNLIWDLLMERTYEDEQAAKTLDALIQKGLFVKNLENIQGDERDILLISTTFGPNKEGNFKQLFGPISQSKGYQLLNVMITRAKQKIAVFTSIPELFNSTYAEEISNKGNTGKGILYAYLNYAEALSSKNKLKQNNVLDLVNTYCSEKNYKHEYKNLPLFNQVLLAALIDKFGSEAVQHNYTYGGFVLELAIISEGKPLIAITTENQHQTNSTAYRMLLFKTQMLESFGIATYFISSLDWFKDWDGEEKKLLERIGGLIM